MKATGSMMIDELQMAAKNTRLKITRDDIINLDQDWPRDPKNKWVNP